MKLVLKSSAIALIASFFASGAHAADLGRSIKDTPVDGVSVESINWSGIYIGTQAGYGTSSHKVKGENTETSEFPIHDSDGDIIDGAVASSTLHSAFSADGLSGHGFFGGLNAGADRQFGTFLIGVLGNYNFSNVKTDLSGSQALHLDTSVPFGCWTILESTDLASASKITAEEGNSWIAAARFGYLFGQEKRALLYGLVGYGQTDVTYKAGDFKKDVTYRGVVAGAGSEYALSRNVFLGIEYQHFFGGEETIASGESGFIKDDMNTDKVMATLKFKLNGGLFGY